MTSPEDDFSERQATALKACKASIAWFAKNKKPPRNLYYASQLTTIALSALTPVLILITDLPKWAQALPAALAAIAASLSSVFNWRDHWVRRASTLESLIAELVRYETRTTAAYDAKLDDQDALNNFVEATTGLSLMEVSGWGRALSQGAEKED